MNGPRSLLAGLPPRHGGDEVRGSAQEPPEYARHKGHADLLPERIDGAVGQ